MRWADDMPLIVPHLWFDKEAKEAAQFYASVLPDSRVTHVGLLRDTPSGDCDVVEFELAGRPFMAISAGPLFKPNPSISFILNFDTSRDAGARGQLDRTWAALADGGLARMPLDKHPFSERYGWVEDRFGVNWQLMLTDPRGEPRPFLTPSLMFVGDVAGRAEEAIDLYTSLFPNSRRGTTARHPAGMAPDREGTLMFADFTLDGQRFAAMDSAQKHDFAFNEAISLHVSCGSQAEIDRYWKALSAVPESEQCGWLKDRFGVSWQIAPAELQEMIRQGTQEQVDRVTQAFLPMKKLEIEPLRRAFAGSAVKGLRA